MLCYKDRTYCPFWILCKSGTRCDRAATSEVSDAAEEASLPVMVFSEFPECFVAMFEQETKEDQE